MPHFACFLFLLVLAMSLNKQSVSTAILHGSGRSDLWRRAKWVVNILVADGASANVLLKKYKVG